MSFTQWFTRSSPTVSWMPARAATRTLVPTPSVESTSTGRSYPGGTRTIPPNAPIAPSASGVCVVFTRAALRRRRKSAHPRQHSGRSSRARLVHVEVDQVLEPADPRPHVGGGHVLEALHAERLDRERAERGAVHHGAAQVGRREVLGRGEIRHEAARERIPRAR